jgi:zinc protease
MRSLFFISCLMLFHSAVLAAPDYAIVSSEATAADAEWAEVIGALKAKHPGAVHLRYPDGDVRKAAEGLALAHPRYTCFVGPHAEMNRDFVTAVHQITRGFDRDPYTDTFWGILTGYDVANALTIAKTEKPLTVGRVASGTEVALAQCEEGLWYCELVKGKVVRKERGGAATESTGPDDSTEALVASLNDYKPDLFVTSGHATERNWMIGFRYKNGFFKSEHGVLYGEDTKGEKHTIDSPNPKVYLPIGNCLMGHIDSDKAMALAWMKSAGVRQMMGYTVPTWYGYGGWGCLDYFVEQPGRYTLTEAFFANQHAMIHRIATNFPGLETREISNPNDAMKLRSEIKPAGELKAQDGVGLLFDRDAVAFYGDPAWRATMAEGDRFYEQSLTEKDGIHTLTITPKKGADSFKPVNMNGAQRGGRPIVAHFDTRLKGKVVIVEGADLKPVIADDFILIPNPGVCDPDKTYRVVFTTDGRGPFDL